MICSTCGMANEMNAQACIQCANQLNEVQEIHEEIQAVQYGGFWLRFVASIIDALVMTPVNMILGGIIGGIMGAILGAQGVNIETIQIAGAIAGFVIGTVGQWLYFTIMETSNKQATVGKMALGLKVTNLQGEKMTMGQANGRFWGKYISSMTLLIGYIMAAFTAKKQALHDIMAGALVVKK